MSEAVTGNARPVRKLQHRGRISQVMIYLGKQFRFFINENDWKVLPMAGVIAGLVGMVIRNKIFLNMEGTLIGAFALTCVAIWNGCFNSIQCVCRERAIVKREHRSGMHVSSYVAAHMIYQLFLCTAQTGLTIYVLTVLNVPFPEKGFMTSWMTLDIGITMLLIAYASDMLSLLISSLAHTTTSAMTIMPFVLIFQLVFSGGIIPLPKWSQPLSNFTISNYGIKAIAAQSGYNELPMVTAWNTLNSMRDNEITGTVTVGQMLEVLDSDAVQKRRDMVVVRSFTMAEVAEATGLPEQDLGDAGGEVVNRPITLGEIADMLRSNEFLINRSDKSFQYSFTLGDIMDIFGEDNVRTLIQQKTAQASQKPEYDRTEENIIKYWGMLVLFILAYALLATLNLEMIDKDKR